MSIRTNSELTLLETRALFIAPGLSVVLLTGCGGGSGASDLPPSAGEAAMNAYLQVAHHTTLNAADSSGNNFMLLVSRMPKATQTMFNGTSAYGTEDTFTLTKNGAPFSITQSLSFFVLNPYAPVGKVYGGLFGNCYYCAYAFHGVVTSSFPLPATLKVGDSGAVASLTYYSDRARAVPTLDGFEADTYSVIPDSAWTRLLCLASEISGITSQGTADGFGKVPETDCYAIDAADTATLVEVTKSVAGETLTFR